MRYEALATMQKLVKARIVRTTESATNRCFEKISAAKTRRFLTH